jgi:magnesium-transporting ATPase (P-type)
MPEHNTLDESLQLENELIAAIQRDSKQKAGVIRTRIMKTLLFIGLTFALLFFLSMEVRNWVSRTFADTGLNTTTTIAWMLVVAVGTYFSARWADRAWGGFSLIRRLGGVSRAVLQVQLAIERAKASGSPGPAELNQIDQLAHRAWDTYVQAMHDSGLRVE